MAYLPTCLEDSLDPWLEQEPDPSRRVTVIDWLQDLCDRDGQVAGTPVPEMSLPTFAALAGDTGVIVVWVVVDAYSQVAVRRVFDVRTATWFGL